MVAGTMPDFSRFVPALQAQGDTLTQSIVQRVQSVAPVGKGGGDREAGTLRDSIEGAMAPTADGMTITVTSGDPVAAFVTEGTAPHEIRPIAAKSLRFEVAGGVVYTKLVHHPGTAPNPFADPLEEEIAALCQDAVQAALAEAFG